MSTLISELAGGEIAERLNGFELSAFKVFKKQNKIEIKFESTALADKTAVFDFEQQIKNLYGANIVNIDITYKDFEIAKENVNDVYEALKPQVLQKIPQAKALLLKSYATLNEEGFIIHIKFGGESALFSNKVDAQFKDLLEKMFNDLMKNID